MGYLSGKPNSNDSPYPGNRWLDTNDLSDEIFLLLSERAKRCAACRRAISVRHLKDKLCPDCRSGVCSRCHQNINDFSPPNGNMTAGYYIAHAWSKYANPGEVLICDACMWSDSRYIADYGIQADWTEVEGQ